ncbi:MAG TPA: GNAT family N-acetyltransferase [Pseudonocardiaceae bacterium]|jgi:ribosomal protein S18 acetylase RimI-like enzyme|nr:GNAT family N-acetyltransferase [Pseudonocardiaceae bacterium]
MAPVVRPVEDRDKAAVVTLSLRAWEPVFVSMRNVLGDPLFERLRPEWRDGQRDAVLAACEKHHTWVAEVDAVVAGFVAVRYDRESMTGEIDMIAVDPDHQRVGLGSLLTTFALDRMRDNGMTVGVVETGGDPGHGPARATYERAGFTPMPIARYFTLLG